MRLVPGDCYGGGVGQRGCGEYPILLVTTADGSDTMGAYPGGDAARLLRSINAQQSHGRIGSTVFPFAAARSAGLKPGTERYEEALWGLVWEGALAVDDHVPLEVAARVPFGRLPYRLAPEAVRLLERA